MAKDKQEEGRALAFAHDPGRNSTVSTRNSEINAQYRREKLQATKDRRNAKRRAQRKMAKESVDQTISEIAQLVVEQHLNEVSSNTIRNAMKNPNSAQRKAIVWVGKKLEGTKWDVDKLRAEGKKAGHHPDHIENAIDYHTK